MTKLLFLYEKLDKFIYRVTENESLHDVCLKFNISPQRLIKLNGLTCNLQANALIYVEKTNKKLYQVMPTDTITDIAQRFNVSESELLKNNCVEYVYPFQLIEI